MAAVFRLSASVKYPHMYCTYALCNLFSAAIFIRTAVSLHMQLSNHMALAECINFTASGNSHMKHENGERYDLCDYAVIVGIRCL